MQGGMEKQSLLKKFFLSRTSILIGVFILVLLTVGFLRAYYKNYQIREEIKSMMNEYRKLEDKKSELKALLDRVKQKDYIEEKARLELGLLKEGENETIIVGNGLSKSGQSDNAVVESKNISNPRQWWNYFFNINI